MEELKKKVKKFYIMFGIEAPAAFFLLFLFKKLTIQESQQERDSDTKN